jgi:hypothetical protein
MTGMQIRLPSPTTSGTAGWACLPLHRLTATSSDIRPMQRTAATRRCEASTLGHRLATADKEAVTGSQVGSRRQTCPVPSLFRKSPENSGRRPPTPTTPCAGEVRDRRHRHCSTPPTPDNTQIYEDSSTAGAGHDDPADHHPNWSSRLSQSSTMWRCPLGQMPMVQS